MRIAKLQCLLIVILLSVLQIKNSYAFYECLVDPIPYPTTPEINNCIKLIEFLKSQNQDVSAWCSNQNNYKQCCLTCQNYNKCKNIAYDQNCEAKARLGQCNQIMANFLPVSYFCPKSCGKCSQTLSCNTLTSGCNGGTCYSATYFSQTSVQCICPANKGGAYCQQTNACLANSCLNGATCVPLYEQATQYACLCRPGYFGNNCEFSGCVNGQQCQNGGICETNNNLTPYCKCPVGYTGQNCEQYIGGCITNICLNGGSCVPSATNPTSYYCACTEYYTGSNCQRRLLCNALLCQNNGICHENLNGGSPYCECPAGTSGLYCQDRDNGCSLNPCQNQGTCIPLRDNDYICICKSTNSGRNCEYYSQGCGNFICQNGGTCYLNSLSQAMCNCQNGFEGQYCERYRATCISNYCLNGGTCIPSATGLNTCLCPVGFIGNKCEYAVNCDRGDQSISQCQNWAQRGFCKLKYTYNSIPVPIYCPISCNMCNDNQLCTDSTPQCYNWKQQNLCPSIAMQNNGLCRKSCGGCYFSRMKKVVIDDDNMVNILTDNFNTTTVAPTTTTYLVESNP